jgi:hypothetical protein
MNLHQFSCPHCEKIVRVRPEHVGRRGHCKHCGGGIALLGKPKAGKVLRATAVAKGKPAASSPAASQPATKGQLDCLCRMGVSAQKLRGLNRETASERIEDLKEANQQRLPPTQKQMDYLARLEAPPILLAQARNQATAAALIEAMHLSPTPAQMAHLRGLGASGAELATLQHRAAAQALILELEEHGTNP